MDNLGKGFVYLIAMGWAGTETILLAANGFGLALFVALAVFTASFILVGCYPLKDATVERLGKQFFALVALSCLFFALGSFGNWLIGSIKLISAVLLCMLVFRLPAPGADASHH